LLVAVVALLLATGCGGASSLDAKAVRTSAEAVRSSAADGALLADDVARGRTFATFVHAHAGELATRMEREAATLRSSPSSGSVRRDARDVATLAEQVARLTGRLGAGADDGEARRIAERLRRAADGAKRLAEGA